MLKEFGRIMDIEHKDVFKENGSTSKIVTVFKTDNEFGFNLYRWGNKWSVQKNNKDLTKTFHWSFKTVIEACGGKYRLLVNQYHKSEKIKDEAIFINAWTIGSTVHCGTFDEMLTMFNCAVKGTINPTISKVKPVDLEEYEKLVLTEDTDM